MSDREMASIPCATCGEPISIPEHIKEQMPDDGNAYCNDHSDWDEELTHCDDA